MAVTEPMEGHRLGTGVVMSPERVLRSHSLPAVETSPKNAHGLLLTKVDGQGYVRYRAGFAWSADGEIATPAQWRSYLAREAATVAAEHVAGRASQQAPDQAAVRAPPTQLPGKPQR